ncbi:hypothetical protein [Bradyrhizobium sp. URHD0069]|uniref:hypothetical protein n=1 Tax=Bradyrhizobium sp. URHD0069 TaxID=1380355 RepID=UPI0012DDE83F|nr:hypothetical protein [Bradyrhizobium sp. URHD0069]
MLQPIVRAIKPSCMSLGLNERPHTVVNFPNEIIRRNDSDANANAIGPEIADPMGAVGNVIADHSRADFLLAKQFEVFLCVSG